MKAVTFAAALLGVLVPLTVLTSAAQARDVKDPPWDLTAPNQTSQAWEFTTDPGPLPYLPTIDENPYGIADMDVVSGTWPDPVPGPDGTIIDTIHIGPEGGITIHIPNNPEPNLQKQIFWQITSDKSPGAPTSNPPGTNSFPYPNTPWPGTPWYTYYGLITIPENPPEEWITIPFPDSTNIEEVVVDTVCIPEPTCLLLLTVGGAAMLRRKRGA
jgi:hypothetical protein